MAPPESGPAAEFPLIVLFTMRPPCVQRPPPLLPEASDDELALTVTFARITPTLLSIPPPAAGPFTELLLTVVLMSVRAPVAARIPPPNRLVLPVITLSRTVSDAFETKTPPPTPKGGLPVRMVNRASGATTP